MTRFSYLAAASKTLRVSSLVLLVAAASLVTGPAQTARAGEIGFIEDFSLAKDRTEALKQLIPGTHEYYYFHCLHYLNTEQFSKSSEVFTAWRKRYPHNYTTQMTEIMNRTTLLMYDRDPLKAVADLRSRLGLHYNHRRETVSKKSSLPTVLDQKRISQATLTAHAWSRHGSKSTNGFETSALDWLIATKMNADSRRHLLQRLQRPDYPNLPALVVADLKHKYSRGFGSFAIHKQLLLSQLDECMKLYPAIRNHTNFVQVYLTKLYPNADVEWRNDPKEYNAYLGRMQKFVQTLAPNHNSLKAHLMYHQLVFNRTQGKWDKDLFMKYVQLPRYASYVNTKWYQQKEVQRYACNLNQNYHSFTQLTTVGNDEPLIRSYLHHFFVKETTTKPYETWLNDVYLRHNFAEVKLVHGLGDPEAWYSMLPPAKVQQIKNRIDLDFAYTNEERFTINDPVSVDVNVKNVKTMIVKVYEINQFNFYRDNQREVDTDINLDGLVANSEVTHAYKEPAMRRVRRHFEFPKLNRRGVFVIDFIGNGKSSRVLVRKGKLRHVVRTSTAGHVITVLDEASKPVKNASIWSADTEYKVDKEGFITLPFSNRPGRQPIILMHDGFASFDYFNQQSERYSLVAGFHADREALVQREKANIMVRPALYLNGTPVTLKVLEDVKLVINSTDHDGVQSSKEVSGFKLFEDREAVYEFTVPTRLQRIQFVLRAKVKNLSQNKDDHLTAQISYTLNDIVRTEKTEDLYLLKAGGQYYVEALGRTGEPLADKPVRLYLKHRDFKDRVNIVLQSDARGRVTLGALHNITQVQATSPQNVTSSWTLRQNTRTYTNVVHGQAGEPLYIPFMGEANETRRPDVSLLELRGSIFVSDQFAAATVKNGFIKIEDLPRGNYDLLLKGLNKRITIKLTEGVERGEWLVGKHRNLEQRNSKPLQITDVDAGKQNVSITLANASPFARVHVFASRYNSPWSAYEGVSRVTDPEPYYMVTGSVKTAYIAGRNIGDEYRYILERKYAKKFAGNMLKRPGLLLNPWAIRDTETGEQVAARGDKFGGRGGSTNSSAGRAAGNNSGITSARDFSNLDFLGKSSAVMLNLTADKNGVVKIKRKDLGNRQLVHVVAVDPRNTVFRTVSLADPNTRFVDLRLRDGLNPKAHYSEQKQISIVKPGDKFSIGDITTSDFEAYDSLSRVYTLYATLSNDPKLVEFSFILDWPSLTKAQKQEKYSKYASHELNFFLYKRDPKFFSTVIKPYLANKRDKTFMDHFLLGNVSGEYVQPWEYGRLNVVERSLLAQTIKGEAKYTSRDVTDRYRLIPPNIDHFNYLFKTALQGSALDAGDAFGFADARDKAMPSDRFKAGLKQQNAKGWWTSRGRGTDPSAGEGAPSANNIAASRPALNRPGAPAPTADAKYANKESLERLSKKLDSSKRSEKAKAELEDLAEVDADFAGKNMRRLNAKDKQNFYRQDEKRRTQTRQYYRKLDKTKEWVENNYYKLPIEQQNANLVSANGFWSDYASQGDSKTFFTKHLAGASRNFTEMMFALSVLDLPFKASEHKSEFKEKVMALDAGSPMVIFHKEIKPASVEKSAPILVSQNFFRHNDRYIHVNGERRDKYVTDEFLVQTVYGCQVVVTNPSSSTQKLDILLQVPEGAIEVLNGQQTKGVHLQLGSFSTQAIEYYFYFPVAGTYPHYPVHVAKNEKAIAYAEPVAMNVVNELSKIDKTSWAWISQNGTPELVLEYLENNNLHRTDLNKIAWRMHDKAYFEKITTLLTKRHAYNHTLFSYGLKHNVVPVITEYLEHHTSFVNQTGLFIESTLLSIDPVERHTFQFREYTPLVNARAHQLGKRRKIVNERASWQYHQLLNVLRYKRNLSDDDKLAISYYMILQDRVDLASDFFGDVNPKNVATRLQYDEMTAYLDFYSPEIKVARGIAEAYKAYPVARWRETFAAIASQLDEIQGAVVDVVDDEDRSQQQTKLAASEPNVEFKVEAKRININYQNLEEVTVNYYLMDVELLFSRNPFVQEFSSAFGYIKPNATAVVKLNKKATKHSLPLPKQYLTKNVLVELVAAGKRKSQAYYANAMTVQVINNYGQVRVTQTGNGRGIAKAYVKVYAQLPGGKVKFYKDGYTDLRGRFDYSSLNTNELDSVQKFALLVLSADHGAVVREATPPKQ